MKRKTGIVYLFIALIFIITTVLTIMISNLHEQALTRTTLNSITQQTNFKYAPVVTPFTLNPDGGITEVQDVMFLKITKSIQIDLKTIISSDEMITIDGFRTVTLSILSEDLWENVRILDERKELKLDSANDLALNNIFSIDMNQIADFIASVEKDTEVRPNKYSLVIKAIYEGNILSGDKSIPLDSSPELKFEIYNGRIAAIKPEVSAAPLNTINMASDEDISGTSVVINKIISHPDNNTFDFRNESKIIQTSDSINKLNLGILKINMEPAKWILLGILILLLFLLIFIPYRRYSYVRSIMSESEQIDRKMGNRIVELKNDISDKNKLMIDVRTFKSLISVAQQKDLQLLRFEDIESDRVNYYVIDSENVYRYVILDAKNETKTPDTGKDHL